MPSLSPDQIAFFSAGIAHQIGSVTPEGRPCLVRGLAADIEDDGRVVVLLSGASGFEVLEAIRATRWIALNMTSPATYRSMMLKGSDAVAAAAGASFRGLLETRHAAFRTNLIPLGFTLEYTSSWYSLPDEDIVAIRFTPTLAWNQTPGPGAGQALPLGG
ncbi:MAG: hypothetical protein REI94_16030 [Moraxellaceae bacterium]|nr:hypothetical protein [Moraxellaceae bacterium]